MNKDRIEITAAAFPVEPGRNWTSPMDCDPQNGALVEYEFIGRDGPVIRSGWWNASTRCFIADAPYDNTDSRGARGVTCWRLKPVAEPERGLPAAPINTAHPKAELGGWVRIEDARPEDGEEVEIELTVAWGGYRWRGKADLRRDGVIVKAGETISTGDHGIVWRGNGSIYEFASIARWRRLRAKPAPCVPYTPASSSPSHLPKWKLLNLRNREDVGHYEVARLNTAQIARVPELPGDPAIFVMADDAAMIEELFADANCGSGKSGANEDAWIFTADVRPDRAGRARDRANAAESRVVSLEADLEIERAEVARKSEIIDAAERALVIEREAAARSERLHREALGRGIELDATVSLLRRRLEYSKELRGGLSAALNEERKKVAQLEAERPEPDPGGPLVAKVTKMHSSEFRHVSVERDGFDFLPCATLDNQQIANLREMVRCYNLIHGEERDEAPFDRALKEAAKRWHRAAAKRSADAIMGISGFPVGADDEMTRDLMASLIFVEHTKGAPAGEIEERTRWTREAVYGGALATVGEPCGDGGCPECDPGDEEGKS